MHFGEALYYVNNSISVLICRLLMFFNDARYLQALSIGPLSEDRRTISGEL